MNILTNKLLPSISIAKSSAYANISYEFSFNAIIKSFIYKSNNNDDIILPCRTPLFSFIIYELDDIFTEPIIISSMKKYIFTLYTILDNFFVTVPIFFRLIHLNEIIFLP